MTVLFADIRGFTSLSETMTPQENFAFINAYLSRMEPIILAHQGFIDKYLGDGIIALFPTTADQAIQGAVAMQKELAVYNIHRQQSGYQPIRVGIGLNTGTLMLGTIGGNTRMDTTVISDTVNVAARLEGLTKRFRANILISDTTLVKSVQPDQYHVRFLGNVQVKGKTTSVPIYELYEGDSDEVIDLKQRTKMLFEQGLRHYFGREFIKAMGCWTQVLGVNPDDKTAQLYIERCAKYISQGVPADWEGVEVFETK
jgi:class 3 adenylate cyclase